MLRKRIENNPTRTELLTVIPKKNRINKSTTILPPSPKTVNDNVAESQESMETNRHINRVQNSRAMFDPNNASPASNFMDLLKLRMSVYYDQEIAILSNL